MKAETAENPYIEIATSPPSPTRGEVSVSLPAPESTAVMSMIERLATSPNVNMDVVERLFELQERTKTDKKKEAFWAAMAQMQPEMPEIDQRGQIKHGDKVISNYAKFEDIMFAIKPVLKQFGFSITHRVEQNGHIKITAILAHREGHIEENPITLPADISGAKNPVQAIGSTLSYGKRQSTTAILGITSRYREDADDDAVGTSQMLDLEKAAEIDQLIAEVKADKVKFLAYMKADSVQNILAKDYAKAKAALNKKKADNA